MPRAIRSGSPTTNWDPTNRPMWDPQDIAAFTSGQWASIFEGILNQIPGVSDFLAEIKTLTGIDFTTVFNGIDLTNPGAVLTAIEQAVATAAVTFLSNVANDIFGADGPLEQLGANFMALLGNPNLNLPPIDFDKIKAAEQQLKEVLTPAGGLSTQTPIPPHLLFQALQTGGAASNALPDGSFDNEGSLDGQDLYTWSSDGRTKAGSAWTTASGILLPLIGVPVDTKPGDITNLSTYAKWDSVTASTGDAIVLAANAYDIDDNLISDPDNRVVQAITVPGSSSSTYAGADVHGWVPLSGQYQAPAGTDYVVMALEVESVVSAGSIGFDDCVQNIHQGFLDASLLKNLENIGIVPPSRVAGVGSIADMEATIQHTWDQLTSAFKLFGVSDTNISTLASSAQGIALNSNNALSVAGSVFNIQNIRNNKPIMAGLGDTVESNMLLSDLGTGSVPTSIAVTQAVSGIAFLRCGYADTKGYIDFLTSGTTGITNLYLNFGIMDASGNITPLFSSSDQHINLISGWKWNQYFFPGVDDIPVMPNDTIVVEFQVVGSGTLNVAGLGMSWQVSHPTATLKQTGATRNTGASGPTPLSISAGSVVFTGNTPYIGLGISTLPADYEPPETTQYGAGSHTWTPPAWQKVGDFVDLVGLGSGGGGGGSINFLEGNGANAGAFNKIRLIVGTDILLGSTIGITAAAGGTGGSAFLGNGTDGGSVVFTYTDASGNPQTLTATGGTHGANGGGVVAGKAAGTEIFNDVPYVGGIAAGPGLDGNGPGGGGGGAEPYGNGGDGADSSAWVRAAQP